MKLHVSDVEGKIPSYAVCLCTMQSSVIELIQTLPDALISHGVSFDLDVHAISLVFMPVLPHLFFSSFVPISISHLRNLHLSTICFLF